VKKQWTNIFLCFCLCSDLFSQGRCPDIPAQYEWNSAEEYQKDAELVKKTLRWLTMAPLNVDLAVRSEANLFVLRWLSGTPDYRVDIQTSMLPFLEDHPELLDSFMHGVALGYLTKGQDIGLLDAYAAGFQSVAQIAAQSKTMSKSRALKPLLRAARNQQLKEYTQKVIQKNTQEIAKHS
jgi:hypothetical protein